MPSSPDTFDQKAYEAYVSRTRSGHPTSVPSAPTPAPLLSDRQFQEEYQRYLGSHSFAQEQAHRRHLEDLAKGGSIRSMPPTRYPIGSVIGSVAMGMAAPPSIPAQFGAGVLGAMGGDALQQLTERVFRLPTTPQTTPDAATSMLEQGAWQAGGTGAAGLAAKAATRILAPFRSTLTPEGREARAYLTSKGFPAPSVLPAEATSSRFLDFLSNIAEHGIGGMGKMANYKAVRQAGLERLQTDFLDSIADQATPDEAARLLLASVESNRVMAGLPSQLIYHAIDASAKPTAHSPGALIDLRPLKGALASMLDTAGQAGGLEARAMGHTLVEWLAARPDLVPYATAKAIRTEVRTFKTMLERGVETKNAPGIRTAGQVYQGLTTAITAGLARYDPFLAEMWADANFLERAGHLHYNPKVIRQLFHKASEVGKADPAAVVTALSGANPEPIKIVRNAVTPSDWKAFQRVVMQGLMMKAGFGTEGGLQGERWMQELFSGGAGAQAKLKAIFDPVTIREAERMGRVIRTLQSKAGAKEGSVWIQLKQAQATGEALAIGGAAIGIGAAAGAPVSGGAAAILLSPPSLAYLMTHPRLSNWFIEGIQLPAGSPRAAVLLGKVLAALPPTLMPMTQSPIERPAPLGPSSTPLAPMPVER